MIRVRGAALVAGALLLAACAGRAPTPPAKPLPPDIPAEEPRPVSEPLSSRGNQSPYRVNGRTYRVMPRSEGYREQGVASWYGPKFHGKPTSNQETFDMYQYSAAHRTLPLPSYVKVTHLENGRSVVVRVNDRGPFAKNRLIDLSYAAAMRLGMVRQGTARVEVEALDTPGQSDRSSVSEALGVYLQVGAFGERGNALSMLQRLRERGVGGGVIHTVDGPDGRTIHRVRVGPLESPEAADSLATRIASLGFEPPRVVFE
ncbi:MAG: septal ring lytic transglycosylase RlpA family protein [Xanthomonadales bacterium]|nr:septal ring lytic transglycosylase RlpA family protein [Xanthomonadales bacterium]